MANDERDVYEVDLVVDRSDIKEALEDLKKLKEELAAVKKLTQTTARKAKTAELEGKVADLEKYTVTLERANRAAEKLKQTTDAIGSRNIRTQRVLNADQISSARADKRAAEAAKQVAIETKGIQRETYTVLDTQRELNEAREKGALITRKELQQGLRTRALKLEPGTNLEQFEDAVKKIQTLQKKTTDPGFHPRGGGEWVKTFVHKYAASRIKALDAREAWLTKMGFLEPEGRTSRIKPRYAPEDPTLPAYENADYFRGQSKADTGEVYDAKSKEHEEMKHARTTPGATRIPQTRGALDDRMYLMIKGVGMRFKVASQYLQELYVTKDAEFEKVARFLSDQYLGTDTQTDDEKAWIEKRFPALTTKELPDEIKALNPSLIPSVMSKQKGQDYKRAHPIHALHMIKRYLAERGYAAERAMPADAINKAYEEVTSGVMGKPVYPIADAEYIVSKDPNVNAIVHQMERQEKKELDAEIDDFVTNHRKMKEVEKKTRAKAIWERLKVIKRAEGTSWTKSRMERMGGTIPKGLEPSEMFDRPNMPDRSEYMNDTAEQIIEKYRQIFGGVFSNINVSGLAGIKTGAQGAVPRMGFRPNKGSTLGRFNLTDVMSGKELGVLKFTQDANDLVIKSLESHVQLRGYGKQLMQAAEAYAKSIGVDRVVLNSVESAVGFYKKLGYTETGTTEPGQWPEMAKELNKSNKVPTKSTKVSGTVQGLAMAGAVETAVKQATEITNQIDEAFSRVEPAIDQVSSQAQSMITKVTNIDVPMMADTLTSPMTKIGGSIKEMAEMARQNVTEVTNVIGNNVLPIGTTVEERIKLQEKAIQAQVRNAYPEEVLPSEIEYKPLDYLVHKFGQTWGGGGGKGDKRAKQARQNVNDMIMKSVTDMNSAEGELSPDLLMEQWGKIVPITHDLHEIIRKVTSHGEAPRSIEEITNYLKRLNNKYQQSMGQPILYPEVGAKKGQPAPEEISRFQQMFGEEYKIKLSFRDYDEFQAAAQTVKNLPGWTKTATREFERYGNLQNDVVHTMEVTGRVRGGTKPGMAANIAQIRQTTETLATGPSAVTERSQLEIGQKRLNLQQRMIAASQWLDKMNWRLVRGQMALLGIAFSTMGVIRLISAAWSTVGRSLTKLEEIFKNIGLAMAFGPVKAQGFLRGMLSQSGQIVDSWKKFTGYTATLNTMLAYFAFRLLQDRRVIFAIDALIEKIINLLSDPVFMQRIFDLIANILEALPGALDWVIKIADVLLSIAGSKAFKELLGPMLAFALAAQFLMPLLAMIGGVFQFASWAAGILAYALGIDLAGALASLKALFGEGWLANGIMSLLGGAAAAIDALWVALGLAWYDGVTGALVMTTTGTLVAVAAGLVAGLAVVWVMIQTGVTAWLAGFGEMVNKMAPAMMDILKILTWPLAMLGTMIIDILTGQFDNIIPDMEAIALKALVALASRIQDTLRMIPFGWGDQWIKGLETFKNTANAGIARLQIGGASHLPQAATGGFVRETGAVIVHRGEEIVPADEVGGQNVSITNYNNVTVNNKTDEKYLMEMLGKKYYSGAY